MLHIIYRESSLINFLLGTIYIKENCRILSMPKLRLNLWGRIIYFLERKFQININPKNRFSSKAVNKIKSINIDDKVLLFDLNNYIDILYIKEISKNEQINLWIWNTLSMNNIDKYLNKLKSKGINIFTFDYNDSESYNIHLLNQVFRPIDSANDYNTIHQYDFFFIGMDKGRIFKLIELASILDAQGYSFKFIVFEKNRKKQVNSAYISYISDQLPYVEILELIKKSRVIVDFTKETQTGLTLRILEASFFGKKVVTNNINVVKTDIYNENNIFVLGKNHFSGLKNFINTTFTPISIEILEKYSINHWIKNFI